MLALERLVKSLDGFTVHYFDSLPSTNLYLIDLAKSNRVDNPQLCLCRLQTDGYGQQSRRWHSDSNSLTFSISLKFNVPIKRLHGLSQLIAVELLKLLTEFTNLSYQLKWPNDIFCGEQKVSGILIEVVRHSEEDCILVIGIGVNIGDFSANFEHYNAGGVALDIVDQTDFITKFCHGLVDIGENFNEDLLHKNLPFWSDHDFFLQHQLLDVWIGKDSFPAIYLGLNNDGTVSLSVYKNNVWQNKIFSSGMVSLRRRMED